ncbi:MAG: UDP-N-acetylmuramate dehydrogenase [Chloroflexota bacterium]
MIAHALDALAAALSATSGRRLRRSEPLAEHTTFRLGGPADLWLAAGSVTELIEAVTLARQHQVPVFILGSGANLLIGEAGVRGLVIENRAGRVKFPAQTGRGSPKTALLTVESGVVLPNLARRCAKRGLSGLEWAVGVPGTMGGAVVNNAGAYGQDLAHQLARAELLSPAGERVWQPVDWFDYAYRSSRLKRQARQAPWIVLQAELQLTVAAAAEIEARLADFNERRKASQPPGATIGSMFKNPPGDYAGRLIEAAGLKGYRYGQAQISPVHANFFQNLGGATATDVLVLIETAQAGVRRKFGIELELEIEIVGE